MTVFQSSATNKKILANLNFYLSIVSLALLLISLGIFSLKSLACDRIRVHKNFMVSLVLLYTTTIGQNHANVTGWI